MLLQCDHFMFASFWVTIDFLFSFSFILGRFHESQNVEIEQQRFWEDINQKLSVSSIANRK